MLIGEGRLGGQSVVAVAQDFRFMAGSLGMAAGEAIITGMLHAVARGHPLILFAASGGARMQEGILSLMQMPRTTIAVQKLREARLPYIVVLTDPTTGGVTASYAMLGDVQIAEPGALICFAGPRVIQQTIREQLPEGFQRAEYLLAHGMIDMVVHRHKLTETLARIVGILSSGRARPAGAVKSGDPLRARQRSRQRGGGLGQTARQPRQGCRGGRRCRAGRRRGALRDLVEEGRPASRAARRTRPRSRRAKVPPAHRDASVRSWRRRAETRRRLDRLFQVTIGSRMTHLDDLLASMKQLHPLLIDLSLDRVERMLAELGKPAATSCRRSCTSPAPTARARPPPSSRRCWRRRESASTSIPRPISCVSTNASRWPVPAAPTGQPIDEDALAALLQRVADVNAGQSITFFEITTAAAFLAFSETPADFLLLEVGLGGRLDTTNVVDKPALTVITPISMDHADKLGDTVEKIAAEKAGILKRGVRCVVARQTPEVDDVLEEEARKRGAALVRWGEHFEAFDQRGRLVFQREDRLLDLPLPSLIGPHQIVNAGTAVAAALELGIDERAIAAGLTSARWPARMQRLGSGALTRDVRPDCELWLDGGHNPAAGEVLARTMADLEERSPRPLVLIVGMMGQKDATGFLQPFAGLARYVITVPVPGAHQPPHHPEALAGAAHEAGLDATAAADIAAALAIAQSVDDGPLRILICGSLYLAGHVLALQDGQETQSN